MTQLLDPVKRIQLNWQDASQTEYAVVSRLLETEDYADLSIVAEVGTPPPTAWDNEELFNQMLQQCLQRMEDELKDSKTLIYLEADDPAAQTAPFVFKKSQPEKQQFRAQITDPNKKLHDATWTPVNKVRYLEKGWDGYDAEPLSKDVLAKADAFYAAVRSLCDKDAPQVAASGDDVVAFAWTAHAPSKRLDVWFHGDEEDAEWSLDVDGKSVESDCTSNLEELVQVVNRYLGA